MQVFRLELKDGTGIYRGVENIWNRVTKNFEDSSLHTHPTQDKILDFCDWIDTEYFFGFETIDDYKTWVFNPYWRMQLGKYGVLLSTYEVTKEHVRKGKGQLIFKKEKAQLVLQKDPFFYK